MNRSASPPFEEGLLQLTVSNRMEELIAELAQVLSHNVSWHQKHLIVVPSPALRMWIEEALCAKLGCLLGVEFSMLDEVPDRLGLPGRRTPLPIELRVHLEACLRDSADLLIHFSDIPAAGEVAAHEEGFFHPMARTLAYLFGQYGVFGKDLVHNWSTHEGLCSDWQMSLWRRIMSERSDCMPALQRLALPIPSLQDIQVHLIGHSSIPKPALSWCRRLGERCSVRLYQLTASPLWCEDLRSGRELVGLRKHWNAQRLSLQTQDELESSILEDQPLLADWGRLSRRCQLLMAKEWSSDRLTSRFIMASGLDSAEQPLPEQTLQENRSATLLDHIKFDLLTLRIASTPQPLLPDQSLHLHLCQSRHHEVEILIDRLISFLQMHPEASWGDLLIASPVPERYRPLLRGAIAAKDLPIPLRWVDGGDLTPLSSWVAGILNLIGTRWSLLEVGRVLLHPFIGQLRRWEAEDYSVLEKFLAKLQIWWGWDGGQRIAWLEGHLKKIEHFDAHPNLGTWSDRLQKACQHILTDPNQVLINAAEWPLLGSFLEVLLALENFHREIMEQTHCSVITVASALQALLETLEVPVERPDEPLLHVLKGICANQPLRQWSLPITSIVNWLKESLTIQESASLSEGIWVGSLQSCRGIPAKAIFLLGMDESSFPTPWNPEPFNRLEIHEAFPSKGDYDRLCLLEAVLGARDRLEIFAPASHTGEDLEGVSPTVSQVISYCQKAFGLPLACLMTRHQRYWHHGVTPQGALTAAPFFPWSSEKISLWELEESLHRPLSVYLRHQLKWKKASSLKQEPVEWSSWQLHRAIEQRLMVTPHEHLSETIAQQPRGRLSEWIEHHCQDLVDLHGLEMNHPAVKQGVEVILSTVEESVTEGAKTLPAIEISSLHGSSRIVGSLGFCLGPVLWVSGSLSGQEGLRQLPKIALWKIAEPHGVVRSWKTEEERSLEGLDPIVVLQQLLHWHYLVCHYVLPMGTGFEIPSETKDHDPQEWEELLEEFGMSTSWLDVQWPEEARVAAEALKKTYAQLKGAEKSAEEVSSKN